MQYSFWWVGGLVLKTTTVLIDHNQNYGMVGQWYQPGYSILLENFILVGRWAGFEDTHCLDGLCYDSYNYDYGMVGQWYKP